MRGNFPTEISHLQVLSADLSSQAHQTHRILRANSKETFPLKKLENPQETDIEDIAYCSKLNSQVKRMKSFSDEVSCGGNSVILIGHRKEEGMKFDESDLRCKRDSFAREDHQKAVQIHSVDLESNLEEDLNRNQYRQSGSPTHSRRNDNNTNSLALNENTTPAEGTTNILNEQAEITDGFSNFQEENLPEIEIYMSKTVSLLLSSAVFSFWSILAIENNWEFLSIFGVIAGYPIIYVLTDLYWTYRLLKDLWIETGDHFKMFDAIGFLFALFIILLKFAQVIPSSTVSSLSFFIIALAYLFSPKKKVSLVLIRWFYTLQCLLITLKLDQHLNFKWEIVLIPIWIYFACLIATCTRSLFYLIKRISFMNSAQNRNITSSQKCGIIWLSCYYGLSLVYFIYLIGAIQALNSGTYTQSLRIMNYLALGINLILTIYTLLKADKLAVFISCYQLIEIHLVQANTENLITTKGVSLQRETKKSYFVKLSSTYFKPLPNCFSISRSKANSVYSNRLLKTAMFEGNYLKHEKEELDHKMNTIKFSLKDLDKLKENTRSELACKGIPKRPRAFSMDKNANSRRLNKKQNDKEEARIVIKIQESIQEEHDKDELKMFSEPDSTPRTGTVEEENICYLCYKNSADAILISCGHGGICYECASNLVKKTNKCMQCRGKVAAIYKIDPNPILDDIVKGVELIKIVV